MACLAKARLMPTLDKRGLHLVGIVAELGVHRPLDRLGEAHRGAASRLAGQATGRSAGPRPSASWTLAVCFRLNSTTSTASQTMWFWQTAWNQNVSMPSGPPADLRIPEEEPGGERLAADVRPAGRVDEEAEHVLLPAVEARAAVEALRRRLEAIGTVEHDVQQFGVVQPSVAGAVDRPGLVADGEDLQGLVAPRQRLGEHAGGRVRREPVDGLLGDAGQPAKLAEAPVVHREDLVLAASEQQTVRSHRPGPQPRRGDPMIFRRFPLLAAMADEGIQRRIGFVGRPPKKLPAGPGEVCHTSLLSVKTRRSLVQKTT